MADVKISGLPASTTPLAGTEVLPLVQSGTTKQVSVANLTAGRSVATGPLAVSGAGNVSMSLSATSAGSPNFYIAPTGGGNAIISWTTGQALRLANADNASLGGFVERVNIDGSGNTTLSTGNLVIGTSGKGINTSSAIPVTFNINNVEAARIHASRGVSIGNTTDPGATNLSVTGSVIPNAVPSSKWGIDFAPSTSAGSYVSIANDATYTLASGSGLFYLYENGGNGAGSFYSFYGTPVIAWQSGASFSVNTPGQAATINIYYSAGDFIIENKFGSTLNFFISTIRLRTAP
jgi:hypothetical protein